MTEEEKEAIKQLKSWRNYIVINKEKVNKANDIEFYLRTTLNLIQKQQAELDKLKNKNKELLRKLRNRVKEVKKLKKYSLYKKEFTKLNREIEKKDKIIDLMAKSFKQDDVRTVEEIKQYFEKKVEEEEC